MKKHILSSILAGAALTAAAAVLPVQAQPIPVALTLSGTATYVTNNWGLGSGGTNTASKLTFTTSSLISWLNNSSFFTNQLWLYTFTKSHALLFNSTKGLTAATNGTGLIQLPAGAYIVFINGEAGITNAAGFWFPLTEGGKTVSVPVKHFLSGSTPVSVYLGDYWNEFDDTYIALSITDAVGQGSLKKTGGTEADQATWTLYYNNQAPDTNHVNFTVTGPLALNLSEGALNKNGIRAITVSATGTGASHLDSTSDFAFPVPPQISTAFVNASIKLAGSGLGSGFNGANGFFWTAHKGNWMD